MTRGEPPFASFFPSRGSRLTKRKQWRRTRTNGCRRRVRSASRRSVPGRRPGQIKQPLATFHPTPNSHMSSLARRNHVECGLRTLNASQNGRPAVRRPGSFAPQNVRNPGHPRGPRATRNCGGPRRLGLPQNERLGFHVGSRFVDDQSQPSSCMRLSKTILSPGTSVK